jgi:hypothetical protein
MSGDKNGPGADVAFAKVATLSEHAFEAPRKGSDLNPVLTAGGATDRSAPVASLPVISSVSVSTSSRGGWGILRTAEMVTEADALLNKASLKVEEFRDTLGQESYEMTQRWLEM